jgi:PleD family two-component response regulator
MTRAEYARQVIEKMNIPHPDSPLGPCVTVCGSVASIIPASDDIQALEKLPDTRLYVAKSSGRNCIC